MTGVLPCAPVYFISGRETMEDAPKRGAGHWQWLLLLPFVALLWVPFYNDAEPSFGGFPFFYWYQFLWVPLTSLIILVVYRRIK